MLIYLAYTVLPLLLFTAVEQFLSELQLPATHSLQVRRSLKGALTTMCHFFEERKFQRKWLWVGKALSGHKEVLVCQECHKSPELEKKGSHFSFREFPGSDYQSEVRIRKLRKWLVGSKKLKMMDPKWRIMMKKKIYDFGSN